MSTPLTVKNKIQLLRDKAEERLIDTLKTMKKELNNDHTLVLDILIISPEISRPLALACELMDGREGDTRLRETAEKLVMCFPEKIPKSQEIVSFDIPAYIVQQLKDEILKAKQ